MKITCEHATQCYGKRLAHTTVLDVLDVLDMLEGARGSDTAVYINYSQISRKFPGNLRVVTWKLFPEICVHGKRNLAHWQLATYAEVLASVLPLVDRQGSNRYTCSTGTLDNNPLGGIKRARGRGRATLLF